MAWHPTLDIAVAVLTNSADHDGAHVVLADNVVNRFEEAGLVTRRCPLTFLPVCAVNLGAYENDRWYFDAHPERTAWKKEWQRYAGKYQLASNSSVSWYGRLVLALGFPRKAFVKVAHEGNGMSLNGVPLVEAEPGLFFSLEGQALDFRAHPPTWGNIALRKR
jgi:hypothetical protein